MQQIDFIRYELATGKILSAVSCPEYAYALNTPPSTGISYLGGRIEDIDAYYVQDEAITPRPSFNLPATPVQIQADGIDAFELNNLPTGTIVTITSSAEEEAYTIDDGELVFATEQADTYHITLNAFPYKETTVTIEAVL